MICLTVKDGKTTARGFEPLRPKANGFQDHPINHSRMLSLNSGILAKSVPVHNFVVVDLTDFKLP
jgi:hypothetical protein